MDTGLLNVLHDSADVDFLPVRDRVHVDLGVVLHELVDEGGVSRACARRGRKRAARRPDTRARAPPPLLPRPSMLSRTWGAGCRALPGAVRTWSGLPQGLWRRARCRGFALLPLPARGRASGGSGRRTAG